MDIYNDIYGQRAIRHPWDEEIVSYIDLRAGYVTPLNLYFLTPDVLHPRAPWDLVRYAGASVVAQLKRDGQNADASVNLSTEIVPNWLAGPTNSATVTMTIASPCVITWTAHGFSVGQAVVFTTTGALPTGLVANQVYYIVQTTTNTFEVSATFNGPPVNTSGTQSGTHTSYAVTSTTRIVTGSASRGEYDRIQLIAPPAAGTFFLNLKGGTIQNKGAASASVRVYPRNGSPSEIEAAFASMIGAPYSIEFVSPTCIDIHGSMCPSGTPPSINEVNVSDLNFLYGWTGNLDLTAGAIANLVGQQIYLVILLTPSGGVQQSVLKLPVNLIA